MIFLEDRCGEAKISKARVFQIDEFSPVRFFLFIPFSQVLAMQCKLFLRLAIYLSAGRRLLVHKLRWSKYFILKINNLFVFV